jgi:hypothetical protein
MSGSGSFVDGGEIQALVRGESFNISGQDWGIWAAFMNGTYTEPEKMISQNWGFALGGGSQKSGYSIGSVIGDKWTNGALSGEFKGVSFANDNEIGALRAMTATGWLDGQYIEVDPGVGTWSAASAGEWVEVTELLTPQQLGFDIADMDKFVSVPITEVYSSIMTGTTILPAGTLSLAMDLSLYATSQAAVDGLWAALVSGNYSGTVNPGWAVTVNSTAPGDASAVTVTNTQWADNQWLANVNGAAGGNSISGQAGGQYGDGALTGAGAGTWSAPE